MLTLAQNSAFVKFEAAAAEEAVKKATSGKVMLGEHELNVKPFYKGANKAANGPASPASSNHAAKPAPAPAKPAPAAAEPTARVPSTHTQRLVGRVAIVTGAAGALGKAIAQRLAKEGARVGLADLDEGGVKAVADAIVAAGGEAVGTRVDVSVESSISGWIDSVVQRWGRLDGAAPHSAHAALSA